LDLMKFAAPPSLLVASQAAAADEVRHATSAFSLAAHFREEQNAGGVQVDSFPAGDTVHLSSSLSCMANRALEEGCLGESAAVARMVYALAKLHMSSPAEPMLSQLLPDEIRHATLAWATVRWAVRQGANLTQVATPAPPPVGEDVKEDERLLLKWAGRVSASDATGIGSIVARAWVRPWVTALKASGGSSLVLPEVELSTHPLGEYVVEAAQLVQAELRKMPMEVVV